MWLDKLTLLCAQPPCFLYQLKDPFCSYEESKTVQFRPCIWDFKSSGDLGRPQEHGLPSFVVLLGLYHTQCTSHFRTLKSHRAAMRLQSLLTVQNHYLLTMRHGFGIAAGSRFGVVSTNASVLSATGNSLHLECVLLLCLLSSWRSLGERSFTDTQTFI